MAEFMIYLAFFVVAALACVGAIVLLCSRYRVENVSFTARFLVKHERPPLRPIVKVMQAQEQRKMGFERPKGPIH